MNEKEISIIIATYNAQKYLEGAIQSIIQQSNQNFELIIIDGNSKDSTLEIIKKYSTSIAYWISEPDKGIYDAWNKGIKNATGSWIMFLGADDLLLPDALQSYDEFIAQLPGDTEYVSSKFELIDQQGKKLQIKGWEWEWPRFLREMTVAHPGSLHHKKLFAKYGVFNTDYKITGDYELLLRPRNALKAAFLSKVTVVMREGGVSDSLAAVNEQIRASIQSGGCSMWWATINKIFLYLKIGIRKCIKRIGIHVYIRKG